MGNVATIIRTVTGFVAMSNTALQNGEDLICLPENRTLLIFHGDAKLAKSAFDEMNTSITTDDQILDIMNKISLHMSQNYQNTNIGIIGCGFSGEVGLIVGLSGLNNFNIKTFADMVTADGDSVYLLLRELLYKSVGTEEQAFNFCGIYADILSNLNSNFSLDFQFAKVTKSAIHKLDNGHKNELLEKSAHFQRAVRRRCSNLFMEDIV